MKKDFNSFFFLKKKVFNLQYTLKDSDQATKQIQLTFLLKLKETQKLYFSLATPVRVHLNLVHGLQD